MDKSTLSNYGWIVIAVLVLAVMIALATPFGTYVKTGVENTTQGLFDTSEKALNVVGMSAGDSGNSVENINHSDIIPEGATYIIYGFDGICQMCGADVKELDKCYCGRWSNSDIKEPQILTTGQEFPSTVGVGDIYKYGDYEYCFGFVYFKGPGGCSHTGDGWCCCHSYFTDYWSVHAIDDKESYGEIIENINGIQVKGMCYAFFGYSIKQAPIVPKSIVDISYAFAFCDSLTGSITINGTPLLYSDCLFETQVTEIIGSCSDDVKTAILATKHFF